MTEKREPVNPRPEGQRLLLLDRKVLELTDVEDVVSFDETGAVLRTGQGMLALDGEDLHVVMLDLSGGCLKIEGKINGLFYSDAGGGKKAVKRLFR
ncbi:MAG: sporulation protein YabP [Ruminococcaceae bacterium]|nr:sporulation protein YabP [Oscillospiraceae bacterium]